MTIVKAREYKLRKTVELGIPVGMLVTTNYSDGRRDIKK